MEILTMRLTIESIVGLKKKQPKDTVNVHQAKL